MEPLKHECGVAMVRLLKPLEYYQEKYGTWMYGLNKLYLMMEKQHNRGQEGAGMACVNLAALPGHEYMFRERAEGSNAITEIFSTVHKKFMDLSEEQLADVDYARHNLPFAGEMYMGHLRYSTTGKSGLTFVHPFLRRNNWRAKNLCLCGNFNMTNVHEIFEKLLAMGQSPRIYSDTYITLELMGHRLDREVERNFIDAQKKGLKGRDITDYIDDNVKMANVLKTTMTDFDGGYVMCGVTGSGESFALRDPWGIRTAFWYLDDEILVLTSERPVIQTVLNVPMEEIHELQPGEALLTSQDGTVRLEHINAAKEKRACSFERIYFSRGSDFDIYHERKELGRRLVNQILPAIDCDIEHTVFSYIPNTAEVAFFGLVEGMDKYLNQLKGKKLKELIADPSRASEIDHILSMRIRSEKVAIKDIKLRTFIAEGNSRNDLAAHVYDITYGSLEPYVDNLVIIDDSIVRGTTLRQSIIRILDRLHPKKTIIVSSSPQIRYPDYYGIDMSSMEQFIAFKAAVALLEERGMSEILDKVYEEIKSGDTSVNHVKEIYAPFSDEEISTKIAQLLTPSDIGTEVQIIFQSIDELHKACPDHLGDWYFTGDYPTPGGMRMLNRTYMDFYETAQK